MTTLDRLLVARYVLDVEDQFELLDETRWLPYYLPQWSSRERSAARFELSDGMLHLLIEEDQEPWCPDLDGQIRVSSLQSGVFSGPVDSAIGQHRFNPAARVCEVQENRQLYTPHFGVFALRARALDDPQCLVTLWMIGYEDRPKRSGEICVFEIFGRNVHPDRADVGMGVHPFGDPDLIDDFDEVPLDIDVRQFHQYAVEWRPDAVTFFVDGEPVRAVDEAPDYPMQFMLGVYDFSDPDARTGSYPRRFTVDWFRGYRPAGRQ